MKRRLLALTCLMLLLFLVACTTNPTASPPAEPPPTESPIAAPLDISSQVPEPSSPTPSSTSTPSLYALPSYDPAIPLLTVDESTLQNLRFVAEPMLPDESFVSRPVPAFYTLGDRDMDLATFAAHFLGPDAKPLDDTTGYESPDGMRVVHTDRAGSPYKFTQDTYEIHHSTLLPTAAGKEKTWNDALRNVETALSDRLPPAYLEHPRLRQEWQFRYRAKRDIWRSIDDISHSKLQSDGLWETYITFEHDLDGIRVDDFNEGVNVNYSAGRILLDVAWHDFTPSADLIRPIPLAQALAIYDSIPRYPDVILGVELVYSNVTNALTEPDRYDLHWKITSPIHHRYINCLTLETFSDSNE